MEVRNPLQHATTLPPEETGLCPLDARLGVSHSRPGSDRKVRNIFPLSEKGTFPSSITKLLSSGSG